MRWRFAAIKLEWKLKNGQDRPSVAWIARKTNSEALYNYLYHATSRSVHFSVGEILRNVWGHFDNMAFDSTYFSKYWSAFSLYWGWKILAETFIVTPHQLVDFKSEELRSTKLDKEALAEVIERLSKFPPPPIITVHEIG